MNTFYAGCSLSNVTCDSSDLYDPITNTCVSHIPDCNLNVPSGGNFYDTVTSSCKSVSPLVFCISPVVLNSEQSSINQLVNLGDKYCPPLNDCMPAGYKCTNDSVELANQISIKQAAIDMVYWKAQDSANRADAASSSSSNSAALAVSAKQIAIDNRNAAQAQYDAIKNNSSVSAVDKTASFNNLARAIVAADNATLAADSVATSSINAQSDALASRSSANSYPPSTSPTSIQINDAVKAWSDAASSADSAESNATNSVAVASGGDCFIDCSGGSLPFDTSGIAQQSTLSSISSTLKEGVACPAGQKLVLGSCVAGDSTVDLLSTTVKSSFDNDAQMQLDAKKDEFRQLMATIQSEAKFMFGFNIAGSGGSLPILHVGSIFGQVITIDLLQYHEQLSIISSAVLFAATIIAAMIIFS